MSAMNYPTKKHDNVKEMSTLLGEDRHPRVMIIPNLNLLHIETNAPHCESALHADSDSVNVASTSKLQPCQSTAFAIQYEKANNEFPFSLPIPDDQMSNLTKRYPFIHQPEVARYVQNDAQTNLEINSNYAGNNKAYNMHALRMDKRISTALQTSSQAHNDNILDNSPFHEKKDEQPVDISILDSIYHELSKEVQSIIDASLQTTSENLQSCSRPESSIFMDQKEKSLSTIVQYDHNYCEGRPSTSFIEETCDKTEISLEERKLCSLKKDNWYFMESLDDAMKKFRSKCQNISEASNFNQSIILPGIRKSNDEVDRLASYTTGKDIANEIISREHNTPGDISINFKETMDSTKLTNAVAVSLGIRFESLKRKGRKKRTCDICYKIFQFKSDFDRHYLTHTGEKQFVCKKCGKGFSKKSNLKYHYRTHTGEKPFMCDVCNKPFALKRNLVNHYRTHTGDKPFVCDVCNRPFALKNTLDKHYRTHTGEKPFVCHVCNRPFALKQTLDNHYRTHTGEKPFVCNVCSKRFSSNAALYKHNRRLRH